MKYFICTILCLLSLLLTANTCDDSDHYQWFDIENVSNETIHLIIESSRSMTLSEFLLKREGVKFMVKEKEVFSGGVAKGETIYIIVYKQSTMDKYSEEELLEQNIYDKLYTLSYDDLEKMGFKITYTGE